MRIRSHVDPTFYVIFLHINAQEYDEDFRALVRSLKPTTGTDIQPLISALRDREHRTFAHERYHFWQGLRLPFLHTYAILTFRTALMGARQMAGITEDWDRWAELGTIVRGFDRLDTPFQMAGNRSGKLAFGRQNIASDEFSVQFSAKEMLEYAASIFDYQVSCENAAEMSDPVLFKRWCKRNPAYLKIFEFLAGFFDSDRLALRTAMPMINAAFHTSFPERALVEIIARVWGNFARPDDMAAKFLAQDEPCRWPSMFRAWLAEVNYDYPVGSSPDTIDLDNYEFYYMDPELWLGGTVGGGFQHPFLGPLSTEWQNRAKSVPGLEFYIDLPGYVANDDAHNFAFKAEPQLRVIRVFTNEGSDKVFSIGEGLVGPAFRDNFFDQFSESDFRGLVLDLLAAYGAFRRATGAQMTDAARTCHHSSCPHFEANYCNCYPLIPVQFEDCGFPARLRDWIRANRK